MRSTPGWNSQLLVSSSLHTYHSISVLTHYLHGQLQKRFLTIITNHDSLRLLDPTPQDKLQLPYMKLLLKVHKFDKPTSHK